MSAAVLRGLSKATLPGGALKHFLASEANIGFRLAFSLSSRVKDRSMSLYPFQDQWNEGKHWTVVSLALLSTAALLIQKG